MNEYGIFQSIMEFKNPLRGIGNPAVKANKQYHADINKKDKEERKKAKMEYKKAMSDKSMSAEDREKANAQYHSKISALDNKLKAQYSESTINFI